jgi:hypothetical protein
MEGEGLRQTLYLDRTNVKAKNAIAWLHSSFVVLENP